MLLRVLGVDGGETSVFGFWLSVGWFCQPVPKVGTTGAPQRPTQKEKGGYCNCRVRYRHKPLYTLFTLVDDTSGSTTMVLQIEDATRGRRGAAEWENPLIFLLIDFHPIDSFDRVT